MLLSLQVRRPASLSVMIDRLAGRGIKQQNLIAVAVAIPFAVPCRTKVEHLSDRVCECVEGTLAEALSLQPVILNEVDDRTLVSESVIDEVRLGELRDYQERLARAVAAASFDASERRAMATYARPVQLVAIVHNARVHRRRVDYWRPLEAVSAVRIIVEDHDVGVLPVSRFHHAVNGIDQK